MNYASPTSGLTLRDIARKIGIHHSTVGRALQNSPTISAARRTQIQATAQEMGYRPNAVAAVLGHRRHAQDKHEISSAIAWINYWRDPQLMRRYREFDLYWKGASSRAERNGYRLEEFACFNHLSPARLERILLARNIQGILIPPHGGDNTMPVDLQKIRWDKLSAVRFGYSLSFPATHLVTSNHLTSGILAIENMWRLGYRRIGLVASPYRHMQFKAGFLIKQAELSPHLKTFHFPSLSAENPLPLLSRLGVWLKKNRPEAILTDLAQMREMLETLGYRVPGDIGLAVTSVVDGNSNAGIDQNSEAIGQAAMDTLISLLHHNESGIPDVIREVLITGTWVDGSDLPQR